MKYAVISDIHGNKPALFSCLKDAKEMGAQAYLFAGDYFMCSPYLNDIIDTLRNLPNAYVIRGNEEEYLSNLAKEDQQTWTDGQYQGLYWCYRELRKVNLQYLASLPKTLCITGENAVIHMAHSSACYLGDAEQRELSSSRIAEKYSERVLTRQTILHNANAHLGRDTDFLQRLNALSGGIYIFGHTHVQWHARFGDKLLINSGSCGLPLDGNPAAAYTLLEESAEGITVCERRVPYDIEAYVRELQVSSLYGEAKVWCDVIIRELRFSYEHVMFFLHFAESYATAAGDSTRPFSREIWSKAYEAWSERLKNRPACLAAEYCCG